MSKEISDVTSHAVDRYGNELTVTYSGVDRKKLAHFGGLDLHISATKMLISDVEVLHFPEKEGDFLIREKVAALYLNEVGEFLRNSSMNSDIFEGYSNMDLVKELLNNLSNPNIQEVINEDNEMIKKREEEIRQDEDEMWSSIIEDFKKK